MGLTARRRIHSLGSIVRRIALTLVTAALLIAIPVNVASARNVYVDNLMGGSVSVIDSLTKQTVGSPIGVGSEPRTVAITPDGRFAYVVNETGNSVSAIDTATNQVVGSPIMVNGPSAIAISPDGREAYVTNGSANVSVIDTASNAVVGSPISVGAGPRGIAIAPDGNTAYVVNQTSGTVSVVNTQTKQAVGSPITVGTSPSAIAITPDGRFAYVTNEGSKSVSVIDTQTHFVSSPIGVETGPSAIAIAPDGRTAYVANFNSGNVSVIDTASNQIVGSPIVVGAAPDGVALSADGRFAYVSNEGAESVSVIDTQSRFVSSPIKVGKDPTGIAIVPDQPPVAAFSAPAIVRPGLPVAFDASGSRDPDGSIAGYAWSFGDGDRTGGSAASVSHVYGVPGSYTVTLTLNDDEGCSTARVFTGQTALCNGSALAGGSRVITVAYPGVRLHCPAKAKPKGCLFRFQAVTKKRRGKAESAVASVKVKAGRSATVSLKPKPAFRAKLAVAKTILVRETAKIDGARRVRLLRLKIVQ